MIDSKDEPKPRDDYARQRWAALERGVALLPEVAAARIPPAVTELADALLALCHLILYRMRTGNRLPLIGIMGSANSGKSTLFNSVAGRDVSRVTPIPHQTVGTILAAGEDFAEAARDHSFLRPTAQNVRWLDAAETGLTGTPDAAVVAPAWTAGARPFVLIDLPDIGTIDADEEHLVALRQLPWLDRVILMVTEESFAQAEHQEIGDALARLRPERARADLFVVLNRRHARTTDADFAARLEMVRSLWPEATVATLPYLADAGRFGGEATARLTDECHLRAQPTIEDAVRKLATELTDQVRLLRENRRYARHVLEVEISQMIRGAARFRKSFFSDSFRTRLDRFSAWQTSLNRARAWLGRPVREETLPVDLLAVEPIQRHVRGALEDVRERIVERLDDLSPDAAAEIPVDPADDLDTQVADLVKRTNDGVRHDIEVLMNALQEDRRVKDPLWGSLTAVSATAFIIDLFLPSVGTLGTLTALGLLSGIGAGGWANAAVARRLRTSQARDRFEVGLGEIMAGAAAAWLASESLQHLDLTDVSADLQKWAGELAEV